MILYFHEVPIKPFKYKLRLFKKYGKHLRILQHSLARKKPGSHNWRNVKQQLKGLRGKIARIRKDWHHRKSTELVRKYESIFVEDMRVKNISSGVNAASAVNVGFGPSAGLESV